MARSARRLAASLVRHRSALAAFVVLTAMILASAAAPLVAPQHSNDPGALDLDDCYAPPMSTTPTMTYVLGTDDQGRDILSAILFGLRVSLFVGISVVVLSAAIGTFLGLVSGYIGGKLDRVVMGLADVFLSFPSILIALFILSVWKSGGLERLVIAIVSVRWVVYARTARGCTLSEREKDYVSAARALGQSARLIMARHILPNIVSPLAVIAAVETAAVIMLEATLSFLGVGTPITKPSLGMLIKNGSEDLLSGNWWISLFPGLALVMLVFSINVLVDWLRDTLNPHLAAMEGAPHA
jgi:peptide/nickel transport system permease protein